MKFDVVCVGAYFSFVSSAQKNVKNGEEIGEGEEEEEKELTTIGCINRTTTTLKPTKPTTTFNLEQLFGTSPTTRKRITRKSYKYDTYDKTVVSGEMLVFFQNEDIFV